MKTRHVQKPTKTRKRGTKNKRGGLFGMKNPLKTLDQNFRDCKQNWSSMYACENPQNIKKFYFWSNKGNGSQTPERLPDNYKWA
jgi:hypothetical protein